MSSQHDEQQIPRSTRSGPNDVHVRHVLTAVDRVRGHLERCANRSGTADEHDGAVTESSIDVADPLGPSALDRLVAMKTLLDFEDLVQEGLDQAQVAAQYLPGNVTLQDLLEPTLRSAAGIAARDTGHRRPHAS